MTAISPSLPAIKNRHYIWAGIIGNALEHYDTALFGLLAPFLAPLFFPTFDPINALILTYGLLPIGFVSRPAGSVFFGWIGDRYGRKQALSISLIGTAAITGLMGCLPIYGQIGILAPVLLAMGRLLQNFFTAGEYVGGAIFILEHHEGKNRALIGSIYSCSTVLGIIAASGLVTYLDYHQLISTYWRYCFWIGFATGVLGIFLRLFCSESPQFLNKTESVKTSLGFLIKNYRKQFLAIAFTAGFSYAIFESVFVFLNGYLPKITSLASPEVMKMNTYLLFFDMALLPFFGWLSDKLTPTKNMLFALCVLLLGAMPLFTLYENAGFCQVILIRGFFILGGVWFCAPFHAWSQTLIPVQHRYTLVSLGYAIGSQLIGSPMASIGFWLYQQTEHPASPAIYLVIVGLPTFISLLFSLRAEVPKIVRP